jgi:CRP-like cAMP-binding protein
MSYHAELFKDGIFKGFAPDETEAFLRRCQENTYPDGTNLFMEQTEAKVLYLIVKGAIVLNFEMPQRENADTAIATRTAGDAIGWSAIVPPHRYRLSGYCKGKTTLIEIDRETLQVIFETNYHLAYLFMRNIAVLTGERLLQVQDKLAKVLADEAVNGW